MYLKGSVPKYLDKEEKELIAYGVNKEGWALDLIKRANDDSIDEIIKTMNMESRYITYEDSN
jgi:hypothetical protein